jgi:hypothetical protein
MYRTRSFVLLISAGVVLCPLLSGCGQNNAAQKQEQSTAFKGGPAPPEVLARLRGQQQARPGPGVPAPGVTLPGPAAK